MSVGIGYILQTIGGYMSIRRCLCVLRALSCKMCFFSLSWSPICRGPICRGPICQGPICQGPICRGPICQGTKKCGPNLPPNRRGAQLALNHQQHQCINSMSASAVSAASAHQQHECIRASAAKHQCINIIIASDYRQHQLISRITVSELFNASAVSRKQQHQLISSINASAE